jgi:hypothetical protein
MYRWMLMLVVLSALAAFTGTTLAAPNCATHCVYAPLMTVPPPDVVMLRQGVHADFPGSVHVIGEMQNTRPEPVRLITIRVDVFDSHDHLVSSGTSFEHLNVLQPNMISCFDIVLSAPTDLGRAQIERVISTPALGAPPRLTILAQHGDYDLQQRAYEVFGQVQNDDSVYVAFASVAATLYNAAGLPIGCIVNSLNNINLAPGLYSGFHMMTNGNDYSDVVSYTLQLDGTRK